MPEIVNRDLLGCSVAAAKIERYLLDLTSANGASKARFFIAFGFDPSRPDELAEALRQHAVAQVIVDVWTDTRGQRWNVVGPVDAPDGRRPVILSGWVKDSAAPPRLVTAFPIRSS